MRSVPLDTIKLNRYRDETRTNHSTIVAPSLQIPRYHPKSADWCHMVERHQHSLFMSLSLWD